MQLFYFSLNTAHVLAGGIPFWFNFFQETTQPVPGKSLETVTGRIVNVSGSAYLRLEVSSIQL